MENKLEFLLDDLELPSVTLLEASHDFALQAGIDIDDPKIIVAIIKYLMF
ncbi:MAG: hypothetical protein WD512_09575 [Candidatus Paceibacterota bacterium]